MKKRILSAFLMVAMVLMLLPGIPAEALITGQTAIDPDVAKASDSELLTYAAGTDIGDGLIVMRFLEKGTDSTDKRNTNAYRIDFGVYHLNDADNVDYLFWFDTSKVALQWDKVDGTEGMEAVASDSDFSGAETYTIFPRYYTHNDTQHPFFINSDLGITATTIASRKGSAQVFSPFGSTGTSTFAGSVENGYIKLKFTAAATVNLHDYVNYVNANGNLNTTAEDSIVYFGSMYFDDVPGSGGADGTSFGIYNQAGMNGMLAYNPVDAGELNSTAAFVGFRETTYNVPITVYQDSTYAALKTSGKVTLTRGSTEKTYTIAGNGFLQAAGADAAAQNVALPAGEWTWKVSGGDQPDGTGTFTVNADGTLDQGGTVSEIKLHAGSTGGGGDTPTGDGFVITLNDADTAAIIAGGTPAVSVNGVTKTATLAADGKLTIQADSIDNEFDVVISVPGYQSLTKSMKFYGGKVTSSGTEVTALALEKATTKVTLPTPDVDDAHVEIKDESGNIITVLTPDTKGGSVSVDLPDGNYNITYVTPGSEDLDLKLEVDGQPDTFGNNDGNKVVVKDSTGTNQLGGDVDVTSGAGTLTSDQTIAGQAVVGYAMYSIVGDWLKNGTDVVGMTLKVYLKGMSNAVAGSFGFEYDKNVFDGASTSAGVTMTAPAEMKNTTVTGTAATKTLAQISDGYVSVSWTANGTVIDASSGLVEIATVTLPFKSGVDKDNYQAKISATTLKEMTFAGSAWDKLIKDAYGTGDTANAAKFTEQIWRTADSQNTAISAPAGFRLPNTAVYTAVGGFFQTFSQIEPDKGCDTKTQIVFPYFTGNKEVTFKVTDGANPVPNATIKVTNGSGTELDTLTTDSNGVASITVPVAGGIKYSVTATNFAEGKGEKNKTELNDLGASDIIQVDLVSSLTHKVELTSDSTNVTLTGGDAANKQDYYFDLTPAAGKQWGTNGKPDGSVLVIKFVKTGETFGTATAAAFTDVVWDAAKNAYKIPGGQITDGAATTKIVIQVPNTHLPVDSTTQYKVVVTSGEGGKFEVADVKGTLDPTGTNTGVVTETLNVGGTESAKYTFKPNDPVGDNVQKKADGETYEGYVIDSVVINGTPATLTNHEKINGVSYQLTGIDQDQSIVVSYGLATIDGNGDIDEPVTPQSEATVTLQLSDHGTAKNVTVAGVEKDAAVEGPAAKTYQVGAGESLVVKFEGRSETVGSTTTVYEVDTVTVDGVVVFKDGTGSSDSRYSVTSGASDPSKGTLTLTGLAKGSNHTVVVLFKDSDSEESMFATLNVVRRSGDGTISPIGSQIKTIGLPVTIKATAGASSKLTVMDLQTPGAAVTDVTSTVGMITEGGTNTYTTPALTAGTTTVGATFLSTTVADADTIEVRLDVQYPSAGSKAATFIFVDGDGNSITYGPDVADENHKLVHDNGLVDVTHVFHLPAGTWTMFVSKNGCLDYILSGIILTKSGSTITAGYEGSTSATLVEGSIVYLSHKAGETASTTGRQLILKAGDATWDGHLIAVNDIAQVAAGLLTGAAGTDAAARADMDENGVANVQDMTIVLGNLGLYNTSSTYQQFMSQSI